jgi:magnesium-transporting ATPase (P-type)
MNTDEPARQPRPEREAVNVSSLKRFLLAAIVIIAVIQVGVWWLYQYFRNQDQRRDVRRTLVEVRPPIPPGPRLQVNPQADFQEYLRNQQETLKSYGWVSRAEGKVRIPINVAMELVVEKEKQ